MNCLKNVPQNGNIQSNIRPMALFKAHRTSFSTAAPDSQPGQMRPVTAGTTVRSGHLTCCSMVLMRTWTNSILVQHCGGSDLENLDERFRPDPDRETDDPVIDIMIVSAHLPSSNMSLQRRYTVGIPMPISAGMASTTTRALAPCRGSSPQATRTKASPWKISAATIWSYRTLPRLRGRPVDTRCSSPHSGNTLSSDRVFLYLTGTIDDIFREFIASKQEGTH